NSAILSQPPVHQMMTYQFHTNLLRSNCPVTSQPDWGTLSVSISILFAISRSLGRDEVLKQTGIQADQLTDGVDVWQAFELSWLN
ncbi:hypothetical protein D6D86_08825, partial [Moraxella catarrhalis]